MFFKPDNRFTYLPWECILLFLLLCSASGASCLSRATGCLSELSCGGRLSFYVYLCVCVCVHYVFMYSCMCVCVCLSEGLGRQLAGAFFQRARLGEPPLQLWLMRSCCWPCRGQSTGTRWGWCLFVVRNRLGQGAPVVKHLNPHKHSSGSDFLLVKDTSSLFFFSLQLTGGHWAQSLLLLSFVFHHYLNVKYYIISAVFLVFKGNSSRIPSTGKNSLLRSLCVLLWRSRGRWSLNTEDLCFCGRVPNALTSLWSQWTSAPRCRMKNVFCMWHSGALRGNDRSKCNQQAQPELHT